MNKSILMGRLTKDPELTTSVCKFSIAVSDGYGEKKHTSFFDMVAFKKTGESIKQYFKKGDKILLECKPKQESWEQKGAKRYKIVFLVDAFHFCDSKGSKDDMGSSVSNDKDIPF